MSHARISIARNWSLSQIGFKSSHGERNLIRTEKSPYSWLRKPKKIQKISLESKKDFQIKTLRTGKKQQFKRDELEKRNNREKQYEQKWQSVTCLRTINSNKDDNNLSTKTSPLTSSEPYSGYRPMSPLTCTEFRSQV